MPYLVDGSNLIGFLRGFALSRGSDQDRLLRRLLRVPVVRKRGLVLVFDGEPSHGSGRRRTLDHRVRLEWSGARRDADTLIRHLLDKAHPNHYILVTDDRELRDYANLHGFRGIGCVEMARMIPTDDEPPRPDAPHPFDKKGDKPLDREEVEDWLAWFQDPDGDQGGEE